MAVETSRLSLTTTAQKVAGNDSVSTTEGGARRYDFIAQATTGVALLGGTSADATGNDSARWDFAVMAAWSVTLEPGEEVWAKVATGTLAVDLIVSGR